MARRLARVRRKPRNGARQNHEASAHDALRSLSRAFRDDVDAVAT